MSDSDRDKLAEDVACASAAYLANLIPAWAGLPAAEIYDRLRAHFETAFLAYHHGLEGWAPPEPSAN